MWYVVYKGRVPGVYDQWEDCVKQVNKFKGNSYKGYRTKAEAEARWLNHRLEKERKNRMKSNFIVIPFLLIVIVILLYLPSKYFMYDAITRDVFVYENFRSHVYYGL